MIQRHLFEGSVFLPLNFSTLILFFPSHASPQSPVFCVFQYYATAKAAVLAHSSLLLVFCFFWDMSRTNIYVGLSQSQWQPDNPSFMLRRCGSHQSQQTGCTYGLEIARVLLPFHVLTSFLRKRSSVPLQ